MSDRDIFTDIMHAAKIISTAVHHCFFRLTVKNVFERMKPVRLCGDDTSSHLGKFRYRITNKEHY